MESGALSRRWDNGTIYQIYPSTFREDATRLPRGRGSIRGITEKIEYLHEQLGVDALWISPFYASPLADGGYDISDATQVHPELGTMADFEELVTHIHEHGMKLMVDYIPNHTSDTHAWFQESCQSQGNPKKDWYIWSDGGRDEAGELILDESGKPQVPNNWASVFSLPQLEARRRGEFTELQPGDLTPPKSAWTWNDQRQQYYLHSFADFQPDLNWSNPHVREAMKNIMRFWLDKGVDGFRIDAVNYIGKNIKKDASGHLVLPNEEYNTAYKEGIDNPYDQLLRYNSCGHPDTFYRYIKEMIDVLYEEPYRTRDTRLIFEAYMEENDLRTIDSIDPTKASSFNFGALDRISWEGLPRKTQLDYYYSRLPLNGVANQVNGNHDKDRLATRLGGEAARAAGLYAIMLPGQMFIYNGEELGLTNNTQIKPSMIKDPNGLRDPERTPILWDDSAINAGFSLADADDLYLPVNARDSGKSVVRQQHDARSSLSLYRHALEMKRELGAGEYVPLTTYNVDGHVEYNVVSYGRDSSHGEVTVVVNFTEQQKKVKLLDPARRIGHLALSSVDVAKDKGLAVDFFDGVELAPNEAIVVRHNISS